MKRSPITRRSPMVRTRRRVKPKLPRPGVTPAMPRDWRLRCEVVRQRDHGRCRRCAREAFSSLGAVDHVLPRRLLIGRENGVLANLALLCRDKCHAWKTSMLEPRLYRGDVLAFQMFLNVIEQSGPIPSKSLLARDYSRLRRLTHGTKP